MISMILRAGLLAGTAIYLAGCQNSVDQTMVSAFQKPAQGAAAQSGFGYRAPDAGMKLTFAETVGGVTRKSVEQVSYDTFSGEPAVTLSGEQGQRILRKSDGSMLAMSDEASGSLVSFTPAKQFARLPARTGDKWTSTYVRTAVGDNGKESWSVTEKCEVLGTELISTPAGRFEALKIRVVSESIGKGGTKPVKKLETRWYAQDLGLEVKSIADNGDIRVLENVTQPRA